jgi:plasmid stabilization system protein ParE
MKLVVSTLRRAEADIDRIYAWIAERSQQGAAHWYQAAREAIKRLARDAAEHGLAPESADVSIELRQKLFKTRRGHPYRLLYTIIGDEVRVLRVRSSGQAPVDFDDIRE